MSNNMTKEKELALADEWFEEAERLNEKRKFREAIILLKKAIVTFNGYELWVKTPKSINLIGSIFFRLNEYDECISFLKSTLPPVKLENLNGNLLIALNSYFLLLSNTFIRKGSHLKAWKYNSKITKINKRSKLKITDYTVRCRLNKGRLLYLLEKHKKSLKCYKKALKKIRISLGKHHSYAVSAYIGLGNVQYSKANYKEATRFYKKAMRMAKKIHGKKHNAVSMSLNNIGVCLQYVPDYDKALKYHKKALNARIANWGKLHPETVMSYNNIANCYDSKGEYNKAIKYHKTAIKALKQTVGSKHPNLIDSYTNLGNCLTVKGDVGRAIKYHEKAIRLCHRIYGKTHLQNALCYNNIALSFYAKEDHDKVIWYNKKALSIRSELLEPNHHDIASNYGNLGLAFESMGKYNEAISYHTKALNVLVNGLGKKHPFVATVYNNLAICYANEGLYHKAVELHFKALKIRKEKLRNGHDEIAYSYNNIGAVYEKMNKLNRAIKYYDISLNILIAIFGSDSSIISQVYNNLGRVFFKQKKYSKSLKNHHKAIQHLSKGGQGKETQSIPYHVKKNEWGLVEALHFKSTVLAKMFEEFGFSTKLMLSVSNLYLATQLIDEIRQSYKTEGSKFTLLKKAKPIYDDAIDVTLELAEVPQRKLLSAAKELKELNPKAAYPISAKECEHYAFQFSEKGKAILLLSSLKNIEALATASIPKKLLNKEYDLRVELNYLDKKIQQHKNDKTEKNDEKSLAKLENRRFDYFQKYEQLVERLEKEHPQYHQLKYDVKVADIGQVQKTLETDEVLLAYGVGGTGISLFAISGKNVRAKNFERPDDFDETVRRFRNAIYSENRKTYAKLAYELYELLLAPIIDFLEENAIAKLLIVPDGELLLLPFEALLTEPVNSPAAPYADYPYLLKAFDISHHYSATLFVRGRKRKLETPKTFLGLAPIYDFDFSTKAADNGFVKYEKLPDGTKLQVGNKTYAKLTHSEEEVAAACQQFKAKGFESDMLLRKRATPSAFSNISKPHRVIHIASHGIVNDQNPRLSGLLLTPSDKNGKGVLHLADIYNLKLQADLVVLNCCNTGMGKIAVGEGVMCINRGFLHAGANNVICSLFSVYDKAARELMQLFYAGVFEGLGYREALSRAKRTFVEQTNSPPLAWAAYVLIGG